MRFNKKIPKFQRGGAYVPNVPFQNRVSTPLNVSKLPGVQTVDPQAQTQALSKEAEEDLKEIAKVEGHSNEVNALFQKKQQLDQQMANLSEEDILLQTPKFKNLATQYNTISTAKINELKRSKERTEYNKEIMKKKEASQALNYRSGEGVYVKVKQEDGSWGLSQIPSVLNAAKLVKDGKAKWVTNQELAMMRDTNPNLVGKTGNKISSRLSYGYGKSKLMDEMREYWKGVGNTSNRRVREGVGELNSYGIVNALETLRDEKKSRNYEQVDAATKAAMSALTQEQKDSLMAEAARELTASGEEITPEKLQKEMSETFLLYAASRYKYKEEDIQRSDLGKTLFDPLERRKKMSDLRQQETAEISPLVQARNLLGGQVGELMASKNFSMDVLQTPIPPMDEGDANELTTMNNLTAGKVSKGNWKVMGADGSGESYNYSSDEVVGVKNSGKFVVLPTNANGDAIVENSRKIRQLQKRIKEQSQKFKEQGKQLTDADQKKMLKNTAKSLGFNDAGIFVVSKGYVPNKERENEEEVLEQNGSVVGSSTEEKIRESVPNAVEAADETGDFFEFWEEDDLYEVTLVSPAASQAAINRAEPSVSDRRVTVSGSQSGLDAAMMFGDSNSGNFISGGLENI